MLFTPRHMPCTECGYSLDSHVEASHTCAPERLIAFTLFSLQESTASFGADLETWPFSPRDAF